MKIRCSLAIASAFVLSLVATSASAGLFPPANQQIKMVNCTGKVLTIHSSCAPAPRYALKANRYDFLKCDNSTLGSNGNSIRLTGKHVNCKVSYDGKGNFSASGCRVFNHPDTNKTTILVGSKSCLAKWNS